MLRPTAETLAEHATSQQLSRVLALAMDGNSQWAFLSDALADRAGLAAHLAVLAERTPHAGQDWLAVVCDDRLQPAKLREIKELAKPWIKKARCEGERVAATLLYHAAVAAACGRHGDNISARSAKARGPLYEDLADILIADPLGRIFQAAADRIAEGVLRESVGNGVEKGESPLEG